MPASKYSSLQAKVFHFKPDKIEPSDLQDNGKLLSDADITSIQQETFVRGKIKGYTVIKLTNEKDELRSFAIYKGEKKGRKTADKSLLEEKERLINNLKQIEIKKAQNAEELVRLREAEQRATHFRQLEHLSSIKSAIFDCRKIIEELEQGKNHLSIKLDAIERKISNRFMIGSGGMGKIKYMQDLATGAWYALKITKPIESFRDDIIVKYAKQEAALAQETNLAIEGFHYKSKSGQARYCFGLKYIGHENILTHIKKLRKRKNLTPNQAQVKALQLAVGMLRSVKHLHTQFQILHRDIKPENFVINAEGNPQIIDLGLAIWTEANRFEVVDEPCGTDGYMAPEIQQCKGKNAIYSEQSEVFALGKSINYIISILMASEAGNSLSPLTKNMIAQTKKMTSTERLKRPSIDQCLEFFEEKLTEQFILSDKFVKTGILNVEEFINADDHTKDTLLRALREVDEVYLMDKNIEFKSQYHVVEKILREQGIRVHQSILQQSSPVMNPKIPVETLISAAPNLITSQDLEKIRSYHYITAKTENPNTYKQLTSADVHIIKAERWGDSDYYANQMNNHFTKIQLQPKHLAIIDVAFSNEIERLIKKYRTDKKAVFSLDDLIQELKKNSRFKYTPNDFANQRISDLLTTVIRIKTIQQRGASLTFHSALAILQSLEKNLKEKSEDYFSKQGISLYKIRRKVKLFFGKKPDDTSTKVAETIVTIAAKKQEAR